MQESRCSLDAVEYKEGTIHRLVSGELLGLGGSLIEVDNCCAELRALAERGLLALEGSFLEVLDLEAALAALRGLSPKAALVVLARMYGFDQDEIKQAFRDRRRLPAVEGDARAFIVAWLNGDNAEEALLDRQTRRSRPSRIHPAGAAEVARRMVGSTESESSPV